MTRHEALRFLKVVGNRVSFSFREDGRQAPEIRHRKHGQNRSIGRYSPLSGPERTGFTVVAETEVEHQT